MLNMLLIYLIFYHQRYGFICPASVLEAKLTTVRTARLMRKKWVKRFIDV